MFSYVKHGDNVFSLLDSWGKVDKILTNHFGEPIRVKVNFDNYSRNFHLNGKIDDMDKAPILFLEECVVITRKDLCSLELKNEDKKEKPTRFLMNFANFSMVNEFCRKENCTIVSFHPVDYGFSCLLENIK